MKHLGLLVLLAGCSGANGGTVGDTYPPRYPMYDVLRLNQVQAKGTHNSYHIEPADALDPSFRYTQASLEAGVHYSSSDFPAPVSSRDYWFDISEGEPAQCNPVFGSDPCTPKDIENLP